MNKKKFFLLLFIIFCIIQLSVPVYMIIKVKVTELESKEFNFQCRAYDPYNPLQGRYVRLAFEEEIKQIYLIPSLKNMSKNKLEELNGKEVNCILNKEYTLADIIDITEKKPGLGAIYFKAKVSYIDYSENIYDRKIHLKFPFDKYFIQEDLAKKADEILRDTENYHQYNPALTVNIGNNGNYVIKSLLIEDRPIEDYIKKKY